MFGSLSAEKEVNVPASEAWNLYGSLQLTKIIEESFSDLFSKVDVVQGDGAAGTVLEVFFAPGNEVGGAKSYKEKFTVVDNEKRLKVVEVVEGGYLDLGFTMFRIRLEVIEKDEACITKSVIEYEVKEEAAANAAIISIQPFVDMMEIAANQLLKNHRN